MVQAVARNEGYRDGLAGRGRVVVQDGDGRRGGAPRRIDLEVRNDGEAWERLDTRAPNYSDMHGCYGDCQQSGECDGRARNWGTDHRMYEELQPFCDKRLLLISEGSKNGKHEAKHEQRVLGE